MKYGFCIAGLALLITGCPNLFNNGDNNIVCTAVFVFGLSVTVTDDMGDPVSGATLTLTEGTYTETMAEFQTGQFAGAGERAGTYTLTVEASGFEPVTLNNIQITADECHVIPVNQDVTMTPTSAP